jgi:hypothetical protein
MKLPTTIAFLFRAIVLVTILLLAESRLAHAQGLSDLPNNTWRKLEPSPSERYFPQLFATTDESMRRTTTNPASRAYSGLTYGDGNIYFMGGGHAAYPGNEVEIYNIAENVWKQQFRPEVCIDKTDPCWALYNGGSINTVTSSGHPWTLHTYQLQTYDPMRKQFIAAYNSGLFAFDLATKDFTRLHPQPWTEGHKWPSGNNFINTKVLIYDPNVQTVLFIDSYTGGQGVYRYDYNAASWQRISDVPFHSSSGLHATYDAGRKKHLISHSDFHSNNGGLWWYDAVTNTWEKVAGVPPEVINTHSLSYDSFNRVVLVAGNGLPDQTLNTMWIYDEHGTWTMLTPNGTPPSSQGTARWGTLAYDPQHNVFIFVDNRGWGFTSTWAYRYKGPSGLTAPPTTPLNLKVEKLLP